jgi:hypothetical protein
MTKRTQPGLNVSETLSLPIESIVETFAILGRRGSGKTSTAVVMAEEMIGAGHPVVIVDPLGVWWGLRSSKTGKSNGLPVTIFGGDHPDVPLDEKAGHLIADTIVTGRFPAILDASRLSKSAMRRFMADFFERLYERNREPLHVFVDEADMMAPQRLTSEGARLFGSLDDIQRRGRARGLGTTLITQRPAVLNKDLLSQSEVLVAMQMTSARDANAIDEWVNLHGDDETAKQVKKSLAGLDVGTGWVWSPALLNTLEKVHMRARSTFDSSATPKPGAPRPVATAFAKVDTAALGAQIAALAEEAAANDPRALRAQVARLEKELAAALSASGQRVVEEKVVTETVAVISEEQQKNLDAATERVREYAANASERTEMAAAQIKEMVGEIGDMLSGFQAAVAEAVGSGSARSAPAVTRAPAPTPRASRPAAPAPARPAARPSPARPAAPPAGDSDVSPARRRLLDALVSLESIGITEAPRNQVALFAGVSPKSSGYANNLGAMNTAGLITYPSRGLVSITDEGRAHVDGVPEVATNEDLHERVRALLAPAKWRILEALIEEYPNSIGRTDLANIIGVSPASSGYANNLGSLRSLGLLDYPTNGYVCASDLLFLG